MTIETKKKQQHDKEKPNENQTKKRKRRETNTEYFKSIIFLKEVHDTTEIHRRCEI
jgi:hypothetical protein